MNRLASVIALSLSCSSIIFSQDFSDEELARLLASEKTRVMTIQTLVTSGRSRIPLLLSWTERPPTGIDRMALYIGLCDAFGELRVIEAIPFLISHMSLRRVQMRPNIWEKEETAIEEHLVAAGALIKIGAAASNALIAIPLEQRQPVDRLTSIFIIARIGDPGARDFLASTRAQAILENYFAEQGLKLIDRRR